MKLVSAAFTVTVHQNHLGLDLVLFQASEIATVPGTVEVE
jgi:hypothetical protein